MSAHGSEPRWPICAIIGFDGIPNTGNGLITVERDKVYAWKWFHTSETASVQKIKVPAELEGNVQKMYRDFYSLPSIVSRMPMPVTKANIASWVINFSQRRMAQAGPANNNFDGY